MKKHLTLSIDEEVVYRLGLRKDIRNLSHNVEQFLRALLSEKEDDLEESELIKQEASLIEQRQTLDRDLGVVRVRLGNLKEQREAEEAKRLGEMRAMNTALVNSGALRRETE